MNPFFKAVVVTAITYGGLGVQHCHADTIDFDFMATSHLVAAPYLDGGICSYNGDHSGSYIQLFNGGIVSVPASLADATIFTCMEGETNEDAYFDNYWVRDWLVLDSSYSQPLLATIPEAPTWLMVSSGFVMFLLMSARKAVWSTRQ